MINYFNGLVLNQMSDLMEIQLFPALFLLYIALVGSIAFKQGDNRHIGFKWSFLLLFFGFISGLNEVMKSHPIDTSPKEVNNKDLVALAFNLTLAILLFCTLLFTQLLLGFLFIPFMVRAIYYYHKYNDLVANAKLISDEF